MDLPYTEGWTGRVADVGLSAEPQLGIVLARPIGDAVLLVERIDHHGVQMRRVDIDVDAGPETLLRVPRPVAAALFQLLLHHFGPPPPDRLTRELLAREQDRVDRAIELLGAAALGRPTGAVGEGSQP